MFFFPGANSPSYSVGAVPASRATGSTQVLAEGAKQDGSGLASGYYAGYAAGKKAGRGISGVIAGATAAYYKP
eukprot:CAMPEP_0173422496 /NCGR_PEP_ID=MMETSP1357-20121228/3180_1 /TAXON_ID=77926 /ORGANISM="Hemiselmis rufescens, Strain PCC563" /LENGTH=72 /DNA_ID=CAMNT_0014385525 /DNA_START=1296 /DNA_END=1514 /DNA_ORIENTATION=+